MSQYVNRVCLRNNLEVKTRGNCAMQTYIIYHDVLPSAVFAALMTALIIELAPGYPQVLARFALDKAPQSSGF